MKVIATKSTIRIEFPRKIKRYNPYLDKYIGTQNTLVGLVDGTKWGLCYVIDMNYKGKDDQFTDVIIDMTEFDLKEFKEICKRINVDVVEI